jgi:hypothetical protein
MLYSIQRLCEERLAVVLVEKRELAEPRATTLIQQLQAELAIPVMLVARDNETWTGARARAEFDPRPHLYALLGMRDIDWAPLPRACCQLEEA